MQEYQNPCSPVKSGTPDELDAEMLEQASAGLFRLPRPDEPPEAVAVAVNRFRSTGRIVRVPLLAWSEVAELAGCSEADAQQLVQSFRRLLVVAA